MEASKVIDTIKMHIEGMGNRQVQINAKIHDLNVELQRLVDERSALESTLYRIEKTMEAEV